MTNEERGSIMEAVKDLPESDKQFVLGYAAGRAASVGKKATENKPEEDK